MVPPERCHAIRRFWLQMQFQQYFPTHHPTCRPFHLQNGELLTTDGLKLQHEMKKHFRIQRWLDDDLIDSFNDFVSNVLKKLQIPLVTGFL
jgi:hypothetical protein